MLYLDILPPELLMEIFSHLPDRDRLRIDEMYPNFPLILRGPYPISALSHLPSHAKVRYVYINPGEVVPKHMEWTGMRYYNFKRDRLIPLVVLKIAELKRYRLTDRIPTVDEIMSISISPNPEKTRESMETVFGDPDKPMDFVNEITIHIKGKKSITLPEKYPIRRLWDIVPVECRIAQIRRDRNFHAHLKISISSLA